jgi:hypothetical protein
MAKTGLEKLVEENWEYLKDGCAYIATGKRGGRWEIIPIYLYDIDLIDMEAMERIRRLVGKDPNTLIFRTDECAWVGLPGDGWDYDADGRRITFRQAARNIKTAYDRGFGQLFDIDGVVSELQATETTAKAEVKTAAEYKDYTAGEEDAFYNSLDETVKRLYDVWR